MGGDSSKHLNSSATTRSRERKRSGVASAFAGGDCRGTTTATQRQGHPGPSYGEIPDHIPAAPVKCYPVPIASSTTLDRAMTWIPDTEVALVTEWNRERQGIAPAGNGRGAKAAAGSGDDGAAADQATPGVTSSASSTCGAVPLACDAVPATANRSTGTAFRLPQPGPQSSAQGGAPSRSTREASVSALPVGMEYYRALQSRWAAVESCSLPPATEEEDLNDSMILEAVSDPDGSALSPPVPLGYMIDLFVPQWRAEGLFEQAELGNQQQR